MVCGFTRRDRIKDEDIQNKVEVTLVEDKMRKVRLRLFGHVMKRCTTVVEPNFCLEPRVY